MKLPGLDSTQRPALLISEVQNGIANPRYADTPLAEQVAARGVVPKIAALADAFRAAGLPVIFCNFVPRKDYAGFVVNCVLAAVVKRRGLVMEGRIEAETHEDLPVKDGDIVIARSHGMAPFHGTELEAILRGENIGTVVLTGVSTNIALPGAATEAIARGFNVVLAEDCTAGATPEVHQSQIENNLCVLATVTDSATIAARLGERRWNA